MNNLNLTSEQAVSSIKDYINELDDMEYAISSLTWELEMTKVQLLKEAGQKMLEAKLLLQQCLQAPEKNIIKYDD